MSNRREERISEGMVKGLFAFLNELTYLIVSVGRMLILSGGVWAANILDIALGGAVWSIVITVEAEGAIPTWVTGSVGILISLVTTRAQIYFNEELITGNQHGKATNFQGVMYRLFNFALSFMDTIVDASLAVYLFFGQSPMMLFEIIQQGVPGMFWFYFGLLAMISMFGDIITVMYLRENETENRVAKDYAEYDSPGRYQVKRPNPTRQPYVSSDLKPQPFTRKENKPHAAQNFRPTFSHNSGRPVGTSSRPNPDVLSALEQLGRERGQLGSRLPVSGTGGQTNPQVPGVPSVQSDTWGNPVSPKREE